MPFIFLIETRPEFTEYSNFLGSDYLLDALGYNPDKTLKRLGDAFFENQLIRDALVRQTNTRFVGNATNDIVWPVALTGLERQYNLLI